MRISPERYQAWQREWAAIRNEYLEGRLPEVAVVPVLLKPGYVRWECSVCDELGSDVSEELEARSLMAARGHAQVHITPEDDEALEQLKVLRMPEDLLTPFQRRLRDELLAQEPVQDDE